jgi:hypothetical protein
MFSIKIYITLSSVYNVNKHNNKTKSQTQHNKNILLSSSFTNVKCKINLTFYFFFIITLKKYITCYFLIMYYKKFSTALHYN